MSAEFRRIRIFVASPGDVQAEREQLARVVDELNLTIGAIAPEKNVALELVRWETHVAPGLGRDAQDVVNRQIGDYEIFIGILWKRMGSPTQVARSGTEEEFRIAYRRWQADKRLPVLFYFCQEPFPPPRTLDEVDQLRKVVEFRAELSNKALTRDYPSHAEFDDIVRPNLLLVLGRMLSETSPHERAAVEALTPGRDAVREQLAVLAAEYDQLRLTLTAGDARTRAMEAVAARMRSLALGGAALLRELIASESAGMRLAAVCILQSAPEASYIPWLTDRVAMEKPFIVYHAALALLGAVRAFGASAATPLREAVVLGRANIEMARGKEAAMRTDEYQVLTQALSELDAVAPLPEPVGQPRQKH